MYIELDLLAFFEVHTDDMIRHSVTVVEKFTILANISYLFHTQKNFMIVNELDNQSYLKGGWNFPKMHLVLHLFDNIMSKNATRNYSMKPFKKMHSPLREAYKQISNFKEVAGQVSDYLLDLPTPT